MSLDPSEKPSPSHRELAIDSLAFFQEIFEIFLHAERTSGVSLSRSYRIGGHVVHLRFAGSELHQILTPALAHHPAGGEEIRPLTVCIWDDISTQTQMPPPPWTGYAVYRPTGDSQGIYTNRGDVRGFSNERILVAYNWDANSMTLLDKKLNLAMYWTHDARRLPSYEISAPLRTVLHWWLNQFGLQFVHSGAVGNSHGGVLLSGKGGVGKSTTSLACLNANLRYVSDDYCLVTADPEPYAYSVYNTAKLHPSTIRQISSVEPALSSKCYDDTDKAVLFLYPHFAEKIITGFPIRAILIPRITDNQATTVTHASPGDGLRALALSTMSQLAYAGQPSLAIMQKIVHQVPCYHLHLGADLSAIPHVITKLIHEG